MADVNKIKLPDSSEYNIKDYRIPGVDTTPTSGSDNIITSGGVYDAIIENELVTSSALNDLNDRIDNVDGIVGDGTDFVKVPDYEDDQEVVTRAINDLNDRITTIEDDSVTSSDLLWERGTGTNSIIIKNSLGNANGNNSTVEGKGCVTGGSYETNTLVLDTQDATSGSYGHAEGRYTIACGLVGSHAEGNGTLASGNAAHAEGQGTIASGARSHAEGNRTLAAGINSHAEGSNTIANGTCSHAEGRGAKTNANYSHAEGICTIAEGDISHAEGMTTRSIGMSSHSECGNWWFNVLITGDANATQYEIVEEDTDTETPLHELYNSVGSEMFTNLLLKSRLAISGNIIATSTPIISVTSVSLVNNIIHASVTVEKTISDTAMTNASGGRLNMTMAYGSNSHSEASIAWGANTHAEGFLSTAIGQCSHSEGRRTITNNSFEHAEGSYNISNKASNTYGNAGNTQHSIGIGSYTERKNAVEVMQNGDVYVYGVGSYNGTNPSTASTVQNVVNAKQDTLISGTNIKTINNESLLGSGNISIAGGTGTGAKVYAFDYTSWDYDVVSGHLSIPLATYEEMVADAQNGVPVILRLQNYTTSGGVITDANACDFYLGLYQQYGSVESSNLNFYRINELSGIFYACVIIYRSANTVGISSFNERMLQSTNQKVNSITGSGNSYQYPSTQAVVNYVAANGGLPTVTSSDFGKFLMVDYDSINGYSWTKTAPFYYTSSILFGEPYLRILLQNSLDQQLNLNHEGVHYQMGSERAAANKNWNWIEYNYYDSTAGTRFNVGLQDTLDTKQDLLVSGTNIKTINNESLLGSGNISIVGGSGGEANVIEAITFNGTPATITNKTAAITATIPSSVADLVDGQTVMTYDNSHVLTAVNGDGITGILGDTDNHLYALGSNNADGNEDYILATTDQIPTVPTNVSSFTNDANYVKYVLCANEAAYNAISNKDSGTLYLIPVT